MTSHLSKNRENQHANELWSIQALFVDLAYFNEPVVNAFQGLIHAKETSFSTKRKVVKDNKTRGIKATISTWKVIKIQFNFAHWFIDWIPNQAQLQKKKFAGLSACHHSLMAPCKIIQCYIQASVAFSF